MILWVDYSEKNEDTKGQPEAVMAKGKGENKDLQNTTEKTKARDPQTKMCLLGGCPGYSN